MLKALGVTLRPGARPRCPRPSAAAGLGKFLDAAEPQAEDEEGESDVQLAATAARPPLLLSFADVVRLAGKRREAKLKVHLEEHVSLVKFDPAGSIELHLLPGAPKELPNELREKLNLWTQGRWMVALSKAPASHRWARWSAPAPPRKLPNFASIPPLQPCCSSFLMRKFPVSAPYLPSRPMTQAPAKSRSAAQAGGSRAPRHRDPMPNPLTETL